MTNLDEIYDLFSWDNRISQEEYERRVRQGLELAGKVKYLFPFFRPFLPNGHGKSVWEPCAKALAARSDEELAPYLMHLFEWLMDVNWPGADVIENRLLRMPPAMTAEALSYSKRFAEKANDEMWLWALEGFEKELQETHPLS